MCVFFCVQEDMASGKYSLLDVPIKDTWSAMEVGCVEAGTRLVW